MFTIDQVGKEVIERALPIAFETYEGLPKLYQTIYDVEPSEHPTHSTGQDFNLNVESVWDDEAMSDSSVSARMEAGYKWVIRNNTLNASFEVSQQAIEDIQTIGQIEALAAKVAPEIAKDFNRKIEQRHWDIINYGAYSAGHMYFSNGVTNELPNLDAVEDRYPLKIYDGQPFFSASHPMSSATGTLSNFTASGALNPTNLKAALTAYNSTNAYDNAGNRIRRRANTLIVPPALEFTARETLESINQPFATVNTKNVLRDYTAWNLVICPYLRSSTAWMIADSEMSGLLSIFHPEYPQFGEYAVPFKLEWEKTGNKYTLYARSRVGMGVTNWRKIHAIGLSTSA